MDNQKIAAAVERLKEDPKLRRDVGIMAALAAAACGIGVALGVDFSGLAEFIKAIVSAP